MLACKNWNEERRGDAKINVLNMGDYVAAKPTDGGSGNDGGMEPPVHVNPDTGANNYELYRKFYMKEEWRRVTTIEEGATALNPDGTFDVTTDRRYLSVSCNHCENPSCVKACPQSNITKDADTGIVTVGENCISCGRCKTACPRDAPQFYDRKYAEYELTDPKRPRMTKCNLCIDRIKDGLKPACVAACWNRALDAGPVDWLRDKYEGNAEGVTFDWELTNTLEPEFPYNASLKPCILFKEKALKDPSKVL
jgi:anaerobic dimethyl sulfoxide reductase subunit B (iron-sulfur subunit)